MVCQQGKIPRDAVVKLLLAESGLQVDLRMILVFFHVAQMAGCAQSQRAADAKMSEQHLSKILIQLLFAVFYSEGNIFK